MMITQNQNKEQGQQIDKFLEKKPLTIEEWLKLPAEPLLSQFAKLAKQA